MSDIKKHIDTKNAKYKWTPFSAVMMVEGDYAMAGVEHPTDEMIISAWQYLVDSGYVWKLQGWFGRVANSLIESGRVSK